MTGNANVARQIVDANAFMTLATADADADGLPWASPVWFAPAGYRELFWVSDPGTRHSRNLAARPQLAIVIFDSQVRPGEGQAVYMSAIAEQLDGAALEAGIRVFTEHFVLRADRDERVPVTP